jgi:GPH family glycoside/pentoside/hexuronide:cation symporter
VRDAEVAPVASGGPGAAASDAPIALSTLLAYCAPAFGGGFMFLLVGLYLMKFATDVLFISPWVMGLIFGFSRIWDAFADPVAGYYSDRTTSRMGRRRPWMLASIVPIGLAYLMAWSPPAALTGTLLVGWMAFAVFAFYNATTVLFIPHTALAAELTPNYHDRTRVWGWRHVFWATGSLMSLPAMAVFTSGLLPPRVGAFGLALGAVVVMALLTVFAVAKVRERVDYLGRGAENPFKAYVDIWRNPHARLILVVFLIENVGGATIGILTPYIAQYIVGRPELTPVFIAFYFVPTIASVPLWVPLSRRFGKKNLWLFAMILTAVSFGGMFFLQENSVVLICVLAVLAGTAGGCGAVVGPSVQTDCIDWDEWKTGERKEGAYFAAWNFVFKGASGITNMLTGIALSASGFVPNVAQTDTAKLALLVLYAIFPLVCYGIGSLLFARFRLGEREHAEIRAALDERAALQRGSA